MRHLLLSTAALTAFTLPAAFAVGSVQENVIVLIVDDMGMDLTAAYGFLDSGGAPLAPSTPNIDRIAQRGILFRNAWAAPVCSSARAEVLTGRYPNRTGIGSIVRGGAPGVEGMSADELTLPDILPPSYGSAVIGKWHLAGSGPLGSPTSGIDHAPRCGFELHAGSKGNLGGNPISYFDWTMILSQLVDLAASRTVDLVGEYATTRTTTDALRAIADFGERPFLLWVAYNAPHKPYHVPPVELIQSPDLDFGTDIGKGHAMIEALDTEIGRLLAGIDSAVLARTTIILLSDNGTDEDLVQPPWDPAKVKPTLYNGGVQVPLLVMGGRIPTQFRGTECERLIDATDIMPTVAELIGVPVPGGTDGTSFLSYLGDPNAPAKRRWIFAERFKPNFIPQPGTTISQAALTEHDQTARDTHYKLLRRQRFVNGQSTYHELKLFDVQADFFETQNLLDAQGNPPVALQGVFDTLLGVLDQMAS